MPGAIDAVAGVTAIETSPGTTVRPKDPVTEPIFALMEQVPLFLIVSIPPGATVETLESDELQVAVAVRSWVLLLLYVPIAFICWLWPGVRLALAPVTWMEFSTGGSGAL